MTNSVKTGIAGTPEGEALFDAAEQKSLLGRSFICAGVAKTPKERIWSLWVSLYGTDFTVISAYPTPTQAATNLALLRRVVAQMQPFDGEALAKLLNVMTDESPIFPAPLPESVVRDQAARIEQHVIRLN